LPSSANSSPHRIYSPGNVFIGAIIRNSGDPIQSLQPVLNLDTLDLEWELASYEEKLELANLSAERLADDYTTRFVTGPMNQAITFRQENETFAEAIFEITRKEFNAGYADINAADLDTADSNLHKAIAQKFSAVDALAKKKNQLAMEQAKNDAERLELGEKITIAKTQIERCSILSPSDGTIWLHVAEGMFVEKGDLLFEVT
jgi:multidrug resistance efflux pump